MALYRGQIFYNDGGSNSKPKQTTPKQTKPKQTTPIYTAPTTPTIPTTSTITAQPERDIAAEIEAEMSKDTIDWARVGRLANERDEKIAATGMDTMSTSDWINALYNQRAGATSNAIGTDTPREQIFETVEPEQSYQDMIRDMIEAQRKARSAALDKARESALASLTEREAGIKPRYYDAGNIAAAQSDIGALNFAQYMASRGVKGSQGGMPEIYRNAALQGQLGALERQKQAEYDKIARDRAGIQQAYEQDRLAALADLDAQALQAYINQMNADRMFGLQQAGLTGIYNGMPTLAAQQFELNKALQEAGLTGQYKGQPTFDYQKWLADNEYRDKTFDENVRQFEMQYGLNLKRMELDEAQRAIDNAYRQGQLTLQQAQQALAEAKFIEEQKQNQWEREQAELKAQSAPATGTIAGTFGVNNVYSDANKMKTAVNNSGERQYTDIQVIDYVMKSGMSEAEIAATLSRLGYTEQDIDKYEAYMRPAYMGEFRRLEEELGLR
jgi:hypothetical protein